MISGFVNANNEAVVSLLLQGPSGKKQALDAIVDTGFNGSLTLPPAVVKALGLRRVGRGQAVLANGLKQKFDICEATVLWDGQSRSVETDSLSNAPLIGMAMLKGHELLIEVEDGGRVFIEARRPHAET